MQAAHPEESTTRRFVATVQTMIAAAPSPTPAGVPQRQPVHPGRFLERYYLTPLAMTQTEAARRLGVSRRRVNELVLGRRSMSPDTAIRCALTFGLPATDWLAMQSEWDSFQTWKSLRQAQRASR
jgi:addiction module HigA family antidote